MPTDRNASKLLYKIAKAYYQDGLTQEQIGERLGLSRIKVSRLLRQAREERVVQILIVPPQDFTVDLERELETAYGLDEAVVVSVSPHDEGEIARQLGPAAADCLVRSLPGCTVLGLTWGSTLHSVVEALPRQNWTDLRVVQMLGGLGRPEADVYGAELAHRTAQALGAKARLLAAPGIVASRMVRDALLSDPQIAETLRVAACADVALVGIGRPTPGSVVMQAGILTQKELDLLQAQGAVGDIALRFFDRCGQVVEHEINDRIIGLDLGQIEGIPRVIGVAGGAQKIEAIHAVLLGKLIHVLVTDDRTAARLLESV